MLLFDTNVVSELRKIETARIDHRFVAWARRLDIRDAYLSAATVYELEYGVRLVAWRNEAQAAILRRWLDLQLQHVFQGRILPVDEAIARETARLSVPNRPPFRDALIAATALVHGMTVVTRNVKDFAASGVPILNPWDA